MPYQIVTDSCCDFTEEQYSSMEVACVPLSIIWEPAGKEKRRCGK